MRLSEQATISLAKKGKLEFGALFGALDLKGIYPASEQLGMPVTSSSSSGYLISVNKDPHAPVWWSLKRQCVKPCDTWS